MNISIDSNIPDSTDKSIVIKLAEAFKECDFSILANLIADECILVKRGKESHKGKESVLACLTKWLEKFSDRINIIVKWFPYNGQPGILLKSKEADIESVILVRSESNKIKNIALAADDYKFPPFFYNELPFNIEFITANVHKMVEPLDNQLFCPQCGYPSESLIWREGIIFQERRGKKYGALSFISFCERCNRVVEMTRNRKWNQIISMTYEQEQKALASLSLEERKEYIDGTFGNKKPINEFSIESKTNALGEFGKNFFGFLRHEIIDNGKKPISIFKHLNHLSLMDGYEIQLHHAGQREDGGDCLEDDDINFW